MKQRALVVGLCLTCTTAWGVEPKDKELTDPIEILKKVDAAAKAVKAVKYKATFRGLGAVAARVPPTEGTVILSGWNFNEPQKFFCDAKFKRTGSSEDGWVTVGGDGEEYFVIDHATKTAYVDLDPAVMGSTGRPAQNLFMLEFVHPTPFSDEINGQKQELKGSKVIGGVDCYEIHVVYASGTQRAIWHFSKKDFLPRARRDIYKLPSGEEASQERIITDLQIDPKLPDDALKFKLPEGYKKTDDFAP